MEKVVLNRLNLCTHSRTYVKVRFFTLTLSLIFRRYGKKVVPQIAPFGYGALHVARMGSVYITMSVTLERFFAVVYPLKPFKAKKFLLPGTAIFSVLYNLPKVRDTYLFIVLR